MKALPWWARLLLVLGMIGAVVVYLRTPPDARRASARGAVAFDAGAYDDADASQ